ncbi:serine/threonine-protein kinase [Tahibacter amnicola]|uniref:Protein kinase n=1 Tax=Tahibacter amnicola TaxID=2976241 RepID=A0ABY6BLG9_9GAMM|nr:serine/threonine-protein kinase [Tahibacter amnicola]UXI70471.1 protein kinase [Tahibacter amnicola]
MHPSLDVWRAANAALDELLELPQDQRNTHLESLSLPDAVRQRVEQMLQAHSEPDGPLDHPLIVAAVTERLIGRTLGIWTLEKELGRGGMAVVYRARSVHDGVDRAAAVKVMTLGALAANGLERFRAEQAILARLNHPGIAQLFDTGIGEDGTPWLAMALVDGQPIDAWCEERGCDAVRIVRLFLDVCEAVAHAHQNLVIHRDIKPSNVMVDADGHVRLLDFGIARLADGNAEATQTLCRVLTPQYASPEQLDGAPPSTAMDVYGLGALLYRLLAGQPPHAGTSRTTPRPPVSAPSRVALRPQGKHLRDLDAVVLKALADEPAERYRTVVAFSDDLRRWLDGEPVLARRPTWSYRTSRFVARHRWGVLTASAAFLALIGVTAAVAWQSARIREESARAHTVQSFLVGLFEAASPDAKDSNLIDTRAVLARGAQDAHANLADGLLKAELLMVIGAIQTRLGQFESARRQLDDALAQARSSQAHAGLQGRIALESGLLAMSEMRRADSLNWLDQAIALLTDQPEWSEKLVDAYLFRATNYEFLGQLDKAVADQAKAEAIESSIVPVAPRRRMNVLQHQARTLLATGKLNEAAERLATSLALLETPRPEDYAVFLLLGDTAEDLGDWDRAEANFRRGLAIAREGYPAGSNFISVPLTYLGNYLVRIGYLVEAAPLLHEALTIRRATPGTTTALAIPTLNVATLERDLGQYTKALALMREARELCTEDPISALLISAQIARALAESDRRAEAVAEVSATRARAESLQKSGTNHPARFARVYTWLALAMMEARQPKAALELVELAQATESPQAKPKSPTLVHRRAIRLRAMLQLGRKDEALAAETALAADAAQLPQRIVAERAYTYVTLAELALAASAPDRARTYVNEANNLSADRRLPQYIAQMVEGLLKTLSPGTAAPDTQRLR